MMSRALKSRERAFYRKALLLIEDIACNAMCDCNDEEKTKKPGYYCPTCEIYGIAHGARGKCCKDCPVMRSGRKKIEQWRAD